MRGFSGGVHPLSKGVTTKVNSAGIPDIAVIPLLQHIGAPCDPVVTVGDHVLAGQLVGESKAAFSAKIHASVSGKVTHLEKRPCPGGTDSMCIVIEHDGKDQWIKASPRRNPAKSDIVNIIRDAGIVGMGGAMFPTHIKLNPKKPVDTVILNCAECEPHISADHRLLLENPDEVVKGLKLVAGAVKARSALIGIEDNKQDAVAGLSRSGGDVKVLATRYPQGAEKMLIRALVRREVPPNGLPMDVGVIVVNAATAYAIYEAAYTGIPLVRRIVTVAGSAVKKPQNLLVRIGTPFRMLAKHAGLCCEPAKIIMGGPMMGLSQHTDEIPVIKGTNGALFLRKEDVPDEEKLTCIRCGRCVDACPMRLVPSKIGTYSEKGMAEECRELNATDCIECGACSYACPSKIPLVQLIKNAKVMIKC
ncbi:MAG: electron transport complex subunit RsxC [archaeon]